MNSRENGSGLTLLLGIVLVLCLIALAALQFSNRYSSSNLESDSKILSHVTQSMNMAMLSKSAVAGNTDAFETLSRRSLQLTNASAVERIAKSAEGANADEIRRAWGKLVQGIKGVLEGEEAIVSGFDLAASAERQIPEILSQLGNVAGSFSQRELQEFTPALTRFEAEAKEVARNLRAFPMSDINRSALADELGQSTASLNEVVAALDGQAPLAGVPVVSNPDALVQLDTMKRNLNTLSSSMRKALETNDATAAAQRSAKQVEAASEGMYAATASVRSRVESRTPGLLEQWWLPLALLGVALLATLAYIFRSRREMKASMGVAQVAAVEQTDKHQDAILRLLDEMGDLADGDLTVEATITEDITGAIADSINYAIEALRELVSTIDGAAESVDSAAQQTQAAANHLAKASESQSAQVSSATESIAKMAASIEQVSANAETSSEVARHSVEIAHKGGEAVRRTIDGMNTIRETIQDTSKRIKRLGESSQEIGNIVELINDIAEQTNILALNASIQASMAGEAGRGFGVVADEVQRLAERSTNATKQIEVLVRTIQSDTNEAVVSMERSTTDVVSGALLAENAGAALDEIEKVSNQIASLVQNISGSAKQQADVAGDVTRNMGVLQEISAQTAENTSATSRSIGNLAEMASRLRRSVAGFTLPKEKVEVMPEAKYDEMLSELAAEENEFIDTLIVKKSTSQ